MTSRAVWFSLAGTAGFLLAGGILLGVGAPAWALFTGLSGVAVSLFFLTAAFVSSSTRRNQRLDRLLRSTRNLERQLLAGRKDAAGVEQLLRSTRNLERHLSAGRKDAAGVKQSLETIESLLTEIRSQDVYIRREATQIRMWTRAVSDEQRRQGRAVKAAEAERLQEKNWALKVLGDVKAEPAKEEPREVKETQI